MSDNITLHPATVDDASIIVRHRHAMFADMGTGTLASRDAMDVTFAPYVARALGDGTYRGWLAQTDEGRVVAGGGLIVHEWPASPRDAQPQPRRAYILNMYTEPEYRSRGLARRIMNAMLDCCRAEKFGSVMLHASDAGRPLYESLGFAPTNEMRLRLE